MIYDDLQMSWKPFGWTMTYASFNEVYTWFLIKDLLTNLNNVEENTNAIKLHPKKFDSRSH